jgi:UDP-N-acetylglucosamine 4,6-dehydratase/5-epimerase
MAPSRELAGKVVLVTGGTGSFGKKFIQTLLEQHEPAAVRVFSRDELKQWELADRWRGDPRLRFFIGDVRDGDRLRMACRGVDVVVHAAALKQVPICEYNPFEAVQTNVVGAENVVAAAIADDVPKTVSLSTDKAVNPVNLYGATKLCAEKIVAQGNAYAGDSPARFASVRYGNVVGSRGSVIPLFKRQARDGRLTITDPDMTRFWITLDQAVAFVIACLGRMEGGETFVPKVPSMRVRDIAQALAPGADSELIGIRPGEKMHEVLITEDEARSASSFGDYFAIYPQFPFWRREEYPRGEPLPQGFRYSSDKNDAWLEAEQIRTLAEAVPSED